MNLVTNTNVEVNKTELSRIIGETIRRLRLAKGWTQEKLAQEVGVTEPYISKLERDTKPPSDNLCEKIAEKLGVDRKRFLLQAHRQRVSAEIRDYLFPTKPYPKDIPEEIHKFLLLYETLDDLDREKVKDLFSVMADYVNRTLKKD